LQREWLLHLIDDVGIKDVISFDPSNICRDTGAMKWEVMMFDYEYDALYKILTN